MSLFPLNDSFRGILAQFVVPAEKKDLEDSLPAVGGDCKFIGGCPSPKKMPGINSERRRRTLRSQCTLLQCDANSLVLEVIKQNLGGGFIASPTPNFEGICPRPLVIYIQALLQT